MQIDLTLDNITNTDNVELYIVMPLYNEGENITNVLDEWIKEFENKKINYQFILVNDGSKDDTLDKISKYESENPKHFVIINKINSGHGRSIRVGYDFAVLNSPESWVLQIDSDGQCSPEYFGEFWKNRNDYDYLIGYRKSRKDGIARLFTSKVCMICSSLIINIKLPDPNVPYRLIKAKYLKDAIKHIPQSFDIHNVALSTILASFKNLKYRTVNIVFYDRAGGENSINFINVFQLGVSMLFDLIKLKKSFKKNSA